MRAPHHRPPGLKRVRRGRGRVRGGARGRRDNAGRHGGCRGAAAPFALEMGTIEGEVGQLGELDLDAVPGPDRLVSVP